MTSTTESLDQSDIQSAAGLLGEDMEAALPLKTSRANWLWRGFGGYYSSATAIIMPDQLETSERGNVYRRAWLVRDYANRAKDSTISLLTDTVELDQTSGHEGSIRPYQQSQTAAKYNKDRFGLKLSEKLGTTPEATLERIHELGGWVTQIAEANLQSRLVREVPLKMPVELLDI